MFRLEIPNSKYALDIFWEDAPVEPGYVVEISISPKDLPLSLPDEVHEHVYDQIASAVVQSVDLHGALHAMVSGCGRITLPQPSESLGRLTLAPLSGPGLINIRVIVQEPYLDLNVDVGLDELMARLYPRDHSSGTTSEP